MTELHELNVKFVSALRISYDTIKDCVAVLKNKNIDFPSDDGGDTDKNKFTVLCDFLLQHLPLFVESTHIYHGQKSSDESISNQQPSYNNIRKCAVERALTDLKAFSEICMKNNYQNYENFQKESNYSFSSLPHCTTWDKMWSIVDDANQVLSELLQSFSAITTEIKRDREMHMRIALKMSKLELIYLYGEEAYQVANWGVSLNNSEIVTTSLERQSCLSEETLQQNWTFKDLRDLVIGRDIPKLTDIFQIQPNLVNLKDKEVPLDDSDDINLMHYTTLLETASRNDDIKDRDENSLPPMITFLLSQKEIYCPLDYLYACINWCEGDVKLVNAMKVLVNNNPLWIHQTGLDGITPLHYAITQGDKDAVKYLLEQPTILVNATDSRGNTPLHTAVYESKCVQLLLDVPGVDVNSKAFRVGGFTPLHLACNEEDKESVELLLGSADIDTNIFDLCKRLPEECSDKKEIKTLIINHRKNKNTGKSLNENVDLDTTDTNCKSAFSPLSNKELRKSWCFNDVWRYLMNKDFKNLERLFGVQPHLVNVCNDRGRTLIHLSVIHSYPPHFIKFLLSHNARRDIQDKFGATVYHYAVMKPKELLITLTEKDCSGINLSNCRWETPFHCACEASNVEVILTLLKTPNLKVNELDNEHKKASKNLDEDEATLKELISKYRIGGIADHVLEYETNMKKEQDEAIIKSITAETTDEKETESREEDLKSAVAQTLELTVNLKKKDSKLGCSFPDLPTGIYVKTVFPDGAATSVLQEGDQLLEVNGVDFRTISHAEAMEVLKNNEEFEMLICRRTDSNGDPLLPW